MTSEQAIELARSVRNVANSLTEYKINYWSNLSIEQQTAINSLQITLYEYAQEIIARALDIELDETYSSVEELNQVIAEGNQAIQHLQNVTDVLNIAVHISKICFYLIENSPEISTIMKKINAN